MCLPRRRQRQPALGEGGGVFLVGGLELARDGHLFFLFFSSSSFFCGLFVWSNDCYGRIMGTYQGRFVLWNVRIVYV